jgi:hypothetical protein
MSTQTSIFTFDHGQKKLNNAIGVTDAYMTDLQDQIASTLKEFVFDENKEVKDDMSPSLLVETCANEFSYSQLVVMSSFYLQDKLDGFADSLKDKFERMKDSVKSIKLDGDDLPPHIKEMLDQLTEGRSAGDPIDGDSLPPELGNFLKDLARKQQEEEGDGDDD